VNNTYTHINTARYVYIERIRNQYDYYDVLLLKYNMRENRDMFLLLRRAYYEYLFITSIEVKI